MDRDFPRTFNPAMHIDYQRLHMKPNGMVNADHNTDVDNLHVNRKGSLPAGSILDQDLRDHPRTLAATNADPNVQAVATNSFHPVRDSRMISFVIAPRDPSTPRINDSAMRSSGRAHNDVPFEIITFTNLSVAPECDQRHVERGRTLQSMAFGPQHTAVAEVGTSGASVGVVLSAMDGISPQHPAMQRIPGSAGTNPVTDGYSTAPAGGARQLDHLALPPGSSILSINPERYAVTPPTYQGAFDTSAFRDPALRQGIPLQHAQRQGLHLQSQGPGNMPDVQSRKVHMGDQPEHLQQQLHLQNMHQIRQHQDGQAQQFAIEHHGRPDAQRQQLYYPPRSRPQFAATRMRQMMANQPVSERGLNTTAERISAKAGRGRTRVNCRTDSVPATPTTAATSSPAPFPTAPSSPDNNGSSSNGSGQREHPCTYPGCAKSFDRRYNLTVHFRRHTDEMPYPCKVEGCPQRFKWRSSQSHHLKTRHQISSAGKGAKISKKSNTSNRNSSGKAAAHTLANGSSQDLRYQRALKGNDGFAKVVSSQRVSHGGDDQVTNGMQGLEEATFSPKKKARLQNENS